MASAHEPPTYVGTPMPESIAAAVRRTVGDARRTAALVLLAERGAPPLARLVDTLCRSGVPFLGGVFPGVVHGRSVHRSGAVVAALPVSQPPRVVPRLAMGTSLDLGESPIPDGATALVLLDGLSAGVGRFVSELYRQLGATVSYVGGGAGSLSLEQRPCVFTADGVHQDAAVLAFVDRRARLGVRHGWRYVHGPLLATRTSRNVIHQLDWRPAFEVYREIVAADRGTAPERGDFFAVAKSYPFGILHADGEPVIRDPIAVAGESDLVCVGEVPANSSIGVFRGSREELIGAARDAAREATTERRDPRGATLIVDCVSRSIFLGDDGFRAELAAIADELGDGPPAFGALTLGEVSAVGDRFVEFLNKTCVVATLHPR